MGTDFLTREQSLAHELVREKREKLNDFRSMGYTSLIVGTTSGFVSIFLAAVGGAFLYEIGGQEVFSYAMMAMSAAGCASSINCQREANKYGRKANCLEGEIDYLVDHPEYQTTYKE